MSIRQPIVVLVGHIDHGKSSILENIKGISITAGEAGGITQTIKFYGIPMTTIDNICGSLLESLKLKLTLPGLLFLDSPGHEAFSTLRRRGGSLADLAILVIDINEGIMPQTRESIEILRECKTPFVIALNKIDLIHGWQSKKDSYLLKNIESQSQSVRENLDRKLYEIVGKLYELGFKAERFDRVDDFTQQLTLVPLSAKTGEGLPELLMILTGIAQKFLEESLKYDIKGRGKGTVLEVKEEKGIGITLDVVIYDGKIKRGDQIVIGTLHEPIITKVKGLFEPEKNKLKNVEEVTAAAGVKIFAQDVGSVIAGMPLRVAGNNLEEAKKEIEEAAKEMSLVIDKEGVIIKADTIGSLEALLTLLREKGVRIKKASIGDISKRDIVEANSEPNPLNKIIIGFNVKSIKTDQIKVITSEIIYEAVDKFEAWLKEERKSIEEKELKGIIRPCKMKIMPGFVFRQSHPAIVGVEILGGILKLNAPLMKDKYIADLKTIQENGENVQEAKKGKEVAIALPGITVGRQIKEGDILFTDISEEDFRKFKDLKSYLSDNEIEVLKEIAELKRKQNPLWGV